MQIKKLKLENFRGIQKQEIELLPNINVFVGINGAGKSTILDAIAISLSWLVERIQKVEAQGLNISDESIKNTTNYSSIELEILENSQIYRWKNIESKRGYPHIERSDFLGVNNLAYFYQKQYQKLKKLPMIAYYPINRIAKGDVDIKGEGSVFQLDVYDNALGSKANFQAFFEWFRLKDDIINEVWKEATRASGYYDLVHSSVNTTSELQLIIKVIEKFIPEYSNLRVTRIPTPRMLVDKNGETLNLNQLSDGEKNMIAMVGDIARRLSMANPNLPNPLEGEGIVMIDEVDLHLHPSWQQKILVNLEKAFPNIQFIVTTHSPQVLTTVKSEGIQGLVYENGQMYIEKFDFSLGAKSNEVLNRILGIDERPQNVEIVQILNRYLELVDKNLYDEEEAIKLRKKLDAWGAGKEKELSKIDMDIRLKEYQRKKYEKS